MTTILVVDDEEVLRETLVYKLELAVYQVHVAVDGPTALEAVQNLLPDLLILDLMLPGLDGLEVCWRVRRQTATAKLPILMLTAMERKLIKWSVSRWEPMITSPNPSGCAHSWRECAPYSVVPRRQRGLSCLHCI